MVEHKLVNDKEGAARRLRDYTESKSSMIGGRPREVCSTNIE